MAKQAASRRRESPPTQNRQYTDADHPLRVRVAPELADEKPAEIERQPGETDEHYAWRTAILKSLLQIPDTN